MIGFGNDLRYRPPWPQWRLERLGEVRGGDADDLPPPRFASIVGADGTFNPRTIFGGDFHEYRDNLDDRGLDKLT